MITKEQKERINELYRKQQTAGLTEEEKKEQESLRRLYIEAMKDSLRAQLSSIKVVSQEEYENLSRDKGHECNHEHHHGHCDCDGHKH
jgi:uncharacterized protein YnzC (UPF0291/DUF896 family)